MVSDGFSDETSCSLGTFDENAIYEADSNYDSDYAADSGYEAWSEEDSSDERDSACGSDASETGTIRSEDLICEENGRKYHTYGILPL
jgi:hypothetical protein